MNVHSVSLKGMRDQNEDKHNIILNIDGQNKDLNNINFLSIFDGHGGKYTSSFLSIHLHKFFIDKRLKYPLKKTQVDNIFEYTQNMLSTNYKDRCYNNGSTSLNIILFKKKNNRYINVINLGDCRAVLCRNNIAIPLTNDHKPMKPIEKNRIEKMGGKIYYDDDWRIMELSVSRAFGDLSAKPYVSHIPDFFNYKLEKTDKFFIMGCDGVWDVMSNQEAVDFVLLHCYDKNLKTRINKKINIAKKLGKYAIKKGSGDNITIIIFFLY